MSVVSSIGSDSALTLDFSADLEVSVSLLIQLDKLVQLLESPVFTCE